MPNLGPGTPNNVNVAPAPTWIFTPNTVPASGTNIVRLYNPGRFPVYVGQQGVNQYNGMPVLPGARPVELVNVTQTLYAACPVTPTTACATISATASTAGSSAFTGTTLALNIPPGTAFITGGSNAATAIEVLVVATSTGTTSITTTTPSLYDHLASSVFTAATYSTGLLQVVAGHN